MNAVQQAQALVAALGSRWLELDGEQRARAVIDWCQANDIDTSSIVAKPLYAAMQRQPFWCQGPENYADMIRSIAAFLAAR